MSEPTPTPSARAQQPQAARERVERIYWSPDGKEGDVAAAWLAKNDPAALDEERWTTAINLEHMDKTTEVVVLIRKPVNRRAGVRQLEPIGVNQFGESYTQHTEPEEYIDEIKPSAPVKVADFWVPGASRFASKIERGPFLEALGRLVSPWQLYSPDAASRKNGELPIWYVLKS